MQIAVAILTRERPVDLITCINACDALASGENSVRYIVRFDDDDKQAPKALDFIQSILPVDLTAICRERPRTLGACWNDIVPALKDEDEAICLLGDDVFPLSPNWDRGVAVMLQRGLETFSWREINDPGNITYPILSRRWLKASGTIFTEWFPYRFADTWLSQVYEFALGQPMYIVSDMMLGGRHGITAGLREWPWWVKFWEATRVLRLEEGIAIRRKLGWPEIDTHEIWDKFERLDGARDVEASSHVKVDLRELDQPPSERYLAAKARAQDWLDTHSKKGIHGYG